MPALEVHIKYDRVDESWSESDGRVKYDGYYARKGNLLVKDASLHIVDDEGIERVVDVDETVFKDEMRARLTADSFIFFLPESVNLEKLIAVHFRFEPPKDPRRQQ